MSQEAPPANPDDQFAAAVLHQLTITKPPVLFNVLLGQLTGDGLKSTSWKKGAKFIAAMEGVIYTTNPSKGVVQVASTCCPSAAL